MIYAKLHDRMYPVYGLYFETKDTLKLNDNLKSKLHSQSEISMVCQRTRPKLILKINKDNEALSIIQDEAVEKTVE